MVNNRGVCNVGTGRCGGWVGREESERGRLNEVGRSVQIIIQWLYSSMMQTVA